MQDYKLKLNFEKFIKIDGVESKEFRQKKIRVGDYTAIILSSRNAVDHFFRLSKELRVEIPDTMKYFCTSESTAYYLQNYVQYRKRKIFHGNQSMAQLVELIKKHKGEKFLFPTSGNGKKALMLMLDAEKIKYTAAEMYKTLPSDLTKLSMKKYDMIIFFSPFGVKSLLSNFPEYEQGETLLAAFGPLTKKAILDSNLRLDIAAPTKTAPSMTMAIEQFLIENKKKKK
ncbi:MAG: uroporphyrinogen-III synthase [Bacteroidota bacterium]|nr:uroporphyrinogen-III synthase [Bacteroidota bacterium]